MSIHKALAHKSNLEKISENMTKQGLSKEQTKVRVEAYLNEAKRKHLKETEI